MMWLKVNAPLQGGPAELVVSLADPVSCTSTDPTMGQDLVYLTLVRAHNTLHSVCMKSCIVRACMTSLSQLAQSGHSSSARSNLQHAHTCTASFVGHFGSQVEHASSSFQIMPATGNIRVDMIYKAFDLLPMPAVVLLPSS